MPNDITELREIMFATLRGLKDGSIDADQAKAISDTAQVLINSAKVEVEYIKHSGGRGTGFIEAPSAPALSGPGAGVKVRAIGRDL